MFLKPDLFVEDITTLDPAVLSQNGVKGIIFDLDSTIMAPKTGILESHVEAWLARLKADGFKLVVLSNNRRQHYVQAAEQLLGFPCIANANKPRRKEFYRALALLEMDPHEVAMIGDRPLTDVLVGNRMGAFTVLVDPLIKHKEKPVFKFLRKLEGLLVKRS